VVELVYPDGSTELVERCFLVEYADDPTGARDIFVAQRAPGSPLRWLRPEALEKVNAEVPVPPKTGGKVS